VKNLEFLDFFFLEMDQGSFLSGTGIDSVSMKSGLVIHLKFVKIFENF
jgi:hypothetical protein